MSSFLLVLGFVAVSVSASAAEDIHVLSARFLNNGDLVVGLRYSGGCKEPQFEIKTSYQCEGRKVASDKENEPVATIHSKGDKDDCEAVVEIEKVFHKEQLGTCTVPDLKVKSVDNQSEVEATH